MDQVRAGAFLDMEKLGVNGVLIQLTALIAEETETPIEDIFLNTRIDELGVDSLDFLDLMLVIGEKFKPIPEQQYAELNTVRDILKAIEHTAT